MTQQIDIGIRANTTGAESGIKKIEVGADSAADSFQDIDQSAKRAGRSIADAGKSFEANTAQADNLAKALDRVAAAAARVRNVQGILARDAGKPVSPDDAREFLNNFDKLRGGRSMGARRLRGYDNFENWYTGHGSSFKNGGDADRHRRHVMSVSMQGTEYSQKYGRPPPADMPPPEPQRPSPSGGGFGAAVERGQSMALAFSKGMLAIAGITSVMGMASHAADMATEESVGTDTLKRRAGDLGQSFDALRDQTRSATLGLGITYVESQRLAVEFARTAGTMRNVNLASALHSGAGFSRAFGLDPSEGTQFFAMMRRAQVIGGDDQGNRKMAMMIGDAVERSGYSGKADELISAIADFTTAAARETLSIPNTQGYASALAGLAGTGIPGLDPAGAAALLGTADAAVRRGGGMGEASLNFSYAALSRATPGLDPVTAQAIMAGGLFGTTRGLFGPGTALNSYYTKNGMAMPGATDETTFSKQMSLMKKMYSGPYFLSAMMGQFGLSSPEQAAALANMSGANLNASANLMGRAGVDISKVSATGIAGLARIANAHGMGDLSSIYRETLGRGDINAGDKDGLRKAFDTNNPESLRIALARVVGTHDQEKTDGQQVRQGLTDLQNELTRVGGLLLTPLMGIQHLVEQIAQAVAPEQYKQQARYETEKHTDFVKKVEDSGRYDKNTLKGDVAADIKAYDEAVKSGQKPSIDDIIPYPSTLDGDYDLKMARRQLLELHMHGRYGGKVPGSDQAARYAAERSTDFVKQIASSKGGAEFLALNAKRDNAAFDRASAGGGHPDIDDIVGYPGSTSIIGYAATMARRQQLEKYMRSRGWSPSSNLGKGKRMPPPKWELDQMAANDKALGLPAGTGYRQIFMETGGRFNSDALNTRSGAMGLAQVMPGTLAGLEKKYGRKLDPFDPHTALSLIYPSVMRDMMKRMGGNIPSAIASYEGDSHAFNQSMWKSDTNRYVGSIMGWTPMPQGASFNPPDGSSGGSGGGHVHVRFDPATVHLHDQKGNPLATVSLKPFSAGGPAGMGG